MFERLRLFWLRWRPVVFLAGLVVASLVAVHVGFTYFQEFSLFAVVLALFSGILILGVLVDRYVLTGIDTLKEIKEGNHAVAITLLALAVLFLACVQFL